VRTNNNKIPPCTLESGEKKNWSINKRRERVLIVLELTQQGAAFYWIAPTLNEEQW